MRFDSLYIPHAETAAAAAALGAALEGLGYKAFDPYKGAFSGLSRPGDRDVRQFAAPVHEGWVRVLGPPDPKSLAPFSESVGVVVWLWRDTGEAGFTVFRDGLSYDEIDALLPWLREDKKPADLESALQGELLMPDVEEGGILPQQVQVMAADVDPADIEKLAGKFKDNVIHKLGGSSAEDMARAEVLAESPAAAWNERAGKRLRALVSCLTLPETWRDPRYEDVRAAYQVARYLKRRPNATQLPSDEIALARVPDALKYEMVYYRRR
jgi:hypothetical protein